MLFILLSLFKNYFKKDKKKIILDFSKMIFLLEIKIILFYNREYAPVAQWIEHWSSEPSVRGSTPLRCAKLEYSSFFYFIFIFSCSTKNFFRSNPEEKPPSVPSLLIMR